jgi:lipopolysaccharide assembly outer membrane protein LptD (OstA)
MTSEGHIYHLRGHAEMRGDNMVLRADTIDYDEEKAAIRLMGHVTIETKDKGTLRGDSAEYHANSGELTLTVKIGPKP